MNKNDYNIRLEIKEEYREVETLVREAFWNVYRPGCLEHYVLKVISVFMAKVDLRLPENTVYAIKVCRREKTILSSCAKN